VFKPFDWHLKTFPLTLAVKKHMENKKVQGCTVTYAYVHIRHLNVNHCVWQITVFHMVWCGARMEKTDSEESLQALRNLVLLIGSLSTCGFVELKPNAKADSLYQMPGFTVPQPSGTGQLYTHCECWVLHCLCVCVQVSTKYSCVFISGTKVTQNA